MRPVAHSTAHSGFLPNIRTAGGKDLATTFTCQYVSCVDDGGSVTGGLWGVQVQQEQGRVLAPPPSLPEQFAHGDTAQASVVSD